MTFNFFNCEKTKVIIEGKCKNVMFQRCKKLEVRVDECLSMMEIIKCENSKVFVNKKVPITSVELSNGIEFFATLESKPSLKVACTAS